jgi:hypothetical protein
MTKQRADGDDGHIRHRTEELTSDQRATYERLRRLSGEAAKHKLPGATSDHDDLYDDFGLPK